MQVNMTRKHVNCMHFKHIHKQDWSYKHYFIAFIVIKRLKLKITKPMRINVTLEIANSSEWYIQIWLKVWPS